MYRTLSAPINLQIEITEKCTHRCRHCYNYFRHGNEACLSLSRDDLRILAGEIEKNKVSRIVLTGGEPLIEPENLVWFAGQLSKLPWISVSLNSNLILLSAQVGKELLSARVSSILTSLTADTPELHDWITQSPGSWQKTVKGIALASVIRTLSPIFLKKYRKNDQL